MCGGVLSNGNDKGKGVYLRPTITKVRSPTEVLG